MLRLAYLFAQLRFLLPHLHMKGRSAIVRLYRDESLSTSFDRDILWHGGSNASIKGAAGGAKRGLLGGGEPQRCHAPNVFKGSETE
jgi:hypothetical protein